MFRQDLQESQAEIFDTKPMLVMKPDLEEHPLVEKSQFVSV